MNVKRLKLLQPYKKFTQLSCMGLILGKMIVCSAFAGETQKSNIELLQNLNPLKKIRSRGPNSYVPADEVEVVPSLEQESWMNKILVEDNSGVLRGVRNDIKNWEEKDEYAKLWNLKSTGLYETPNQAAKKQYLDKKILKYVDKRISGEVKNAEEGSALHRVGQVQKALKPNAEAQISKRIKLKFKARVLQQKAIVRVDNPWVDYNSEINADGQVQMNMHKDIKSLGVKTNVQYQLSEETWVATVDRPLNAQWTARVSSSQTDKDMAFSEDSNRTVQLLYNLSW